MKIPERNPRPVDEAPYRRDEADVPPVFHRVKHESRVLAVIGIVIGYCVSFCLLIVGAICLTDNEIFAIGVVITVFGAGVLGASIKGSWSLSNGPLIHVITFEIDRVVWGYVGKEQTLDASEIESINWAVNTENDLTLSLRTRAGNRITFYYIDRLVHRKQRPELLAYLKACYPDVVLAESDRS